MYIHQQHINVGSLTRQHSLTAKELFYYFSGSVYSVTKMSMLRNTRKGGELTYVRQRCNSNVQPFLVVTCTVKRQRDVCSNSPCSSLYFLSIKCFSIRIEGGIGFICKFLVYDKIKHSSQCCIRLISNNQINRISFISIQNSK